MREYYKKNQIIIEKKENKLSDEVSALTNFEVPSGLESLPLTIVISYNLSVHVAVVS